MRLTSLQGDEINREARRIADGIAKYIEPDFARLAQHYRDPMAAAAVVVAGLLTAAGDGVGTQAHMCRIEWTLEDIRELHAELQAAVHKATMKIHSRTTGRTN